MKPLLMNWVIFKVGGEIKILILITILCLPLNLGGVVEAYASETRMLTIVTDEDLNHNNYGLKSSETESEYTISSNIYDTLLQMDHNGRLMEGLAVNWDVVGPNIIRLVLRPGVLFHDGSSLDAEDVKFSIEYFLGKNMFLSFMLDSIKTVNILSKYDIDIILKRSDGAILHKLAVWARIFSKDAFENLGEEQYERHPIGTGPYILEDIMKGEWVLLRKNNNYWNATMEGIDAIKYVYISDPKTRLKHVVNKKADVVANIEAQNALVAAKTGAYRVIKQPSYYAVFGIFNVKNSASPVNDMRVRKAINHAIDRAFLKRLILKGNGKLIASLTMPGEIGHDSNLAPYEYNLHKAMRHMKDAGYGNGFEMHVGLQPGLSANSDYCRFISESLKKINIDVIYDGNFDLRTLSSSNRQAANGVWNGDMLLGGDPSPYMHSDFFLKCFFVKNALYSLVDDSVLHDLYQDAIANTDMEHQDIAFREIDSYIYDNAYGLFSHQLVRIYVIRKYLTYTPSINGMLNMRDIWFSEEKI